MSPRVKPRIPKKFDYRASSNEGRARAASSMSFSGTFEGETQEEMQDAVKAALLQLHADLVADTKANLGGSAKASA